MQLDRDDVEMLTFICPTEDCQEMKDVFKIYIDRDDPILKRLKGWKDLL